MLLNTGEEAVRSTHGLLTTVAYKLGPHEPTTFALEGSVAIAGAAVKWLRDNLGIIKRSGEISDLAAQVPDTGGVYFVPALSGLLAPHWREDARGCIVGLTQHTTKHHLARATLEAVALQTREILEAMNQDAGTHLTALRVDGGLTVSDVLMSIQADILGLEVHRPVMRETTALGAALAAGLGVGVWEGGSAGLERHFHPKLGHDVFAPPPGHEAAGAEKMRQWKRALARSLGWAEGAEGAASSSAAS
jgi:glycerol kinase